MAKKPVSVTCTAAQAAAFRLSRHHLDRSAETDARRTPGSRRAKRSSESIVDVVRDTGGIQAQVMSAAELALWTRRRQTTREEIRTALWTRRDIVRTSAMRLTLHVVPSRDLPIYIAALQPMAAAILRRAQGRTGTKPAHVAAMIDAVVDALDDEPKTQAELIAAVRGNAGTGVRGWLEHMGSPLRPAVIEGLIVYGPPRGAETTFVRTDVWLPAYRAIAKNGMDEARAELLRRFLSAYGPATAHDFAKWSGLKTSEARSILAAIEDELAHVSVDGAPGWIRRVDRERLDASALDVHAVRLLGAFDSFLLAHATKEHLVPAAFYQRVYRPQGWISPVVLRGGVIVGVWFPSTARSQSALDVQLFARATPALREGIAREAEAIGRFLGARSDVRVRTV
jgi:uncharacterized protein YcaQ